MMSQFALLAIILCATVALSAAKSCDPSKGDSWSNSNTFNPDPEEPYCVRVADGPPVPTYECRACSIQNGNCDCEVDEFCSRELGNRGECIEFEKAGDDCRPMSWQQLKDKNIPEEWKCAYLYETSEGLQIDQEGACVEGTCRHCGRTSGNGMQECNDGYGLKAARRCAYPGELYTAQRENWAPGNYISEPVHVWWAVVFSLVVLLVLVQIAALLIK